MANIGSSLVTGAVTQDGRYRAHELAGSSHGAPVDCGALAGKS